MSQSSMCNMILIEGNHKYMYEDAQKRNKKVLQNISNKEHLVDIGISYFVLMILFFISSHV